MRGDAGRRDVSRLYGQLELDKAIKSNLELCCLIK